MTDLWTNDSDELIIFNKSVKMIHKALKLAHELGLK